MPSAAEKLMSLDEFLAWEREQPERHDLKQEAQHEREAQPRPRCHPATDQVGDDAEKLVEEE